VYTSVIRSDPNKNRGFFYSRHYHVFSKIRHYNSSIWKTVRVPHPYHFLRLQRILAHCQARYAERKAYMPTGTSVWVEERPLAVGRALARGGLAERPWRRRSRAPRRKLPGSPGWSRRSRTASPAPRAPPWLRAALPRIHALRCGNLPRGGAYPGGRTPA
jgi:hypothetical protein